MEKIVVPASKSKDFTQELEFYKNIARNIPALITVYNINTGVYLYVNSAIKKILGYTPQDLLLGGAPFIISLMHPEDATGILEKNRRALIRANAMKNKSINENSILNFEYRIRNKNGNWRWLHTDGLVFDRDEQGLVAHVINISVDITKRKKTEEMTSHTNHVLKETKAHLERLKTILERKVNERTRSVTQTQQRYKALIEHSSDGIVLFDRDQKMTYVSPSAHKMFGYPKTDLSQINIPSYIHPDDLGLLQDTFTQLFKTPDKRITQYLRVRHFKGTYLRIQLTAVNLLAHSGVSAIVSNFRDVTEQWESDRRQKLLDRISQKLVTSSADYVKTISQIAKLIVNSLADYCRIALVNEKREIRYIAVSHDNPEKISLTQELLDTYINDPKSTYGIGNIIKTGKAELISEVDDDVLSLAKHNQKLVQIVKNIGLKSYMGVPLVVHGKTIGAITFSSTQEYGYYTQKDLRFAKEIARRIALSIENSLLYADAQTELRERIRVEAKLRSHQERLELAQSAAHIGTFEWDIVQDRLYWSAELEKLYNLAPGTFGGHSRDWLKLVHHEDRDHLKKTINNYSLGQATQEDEFRIIWPDQSIHWLYAKSRIFYNAHKQPIRAVGINFDITQRKITENNLHFLAEASKLLSSTLDYQTTLNSVTKLAVPQIADWCSIDLVKPNGKIELVAIAHKNPKKVTWAKKLRSANPIDPNASQGIPNVLKTGKSEFYPLITDQMLVSLSKTKKDLQLLRSIGFTSAMIVPLFSQTAIVGAITFATTETHRHYNQGDLIMAEELAHRASLAIDNARLYKGSQEAITLRDDFISVASHELKTPITSVKIFTQVLAQHSKEIGDRRAIEYLGKMDKQINKLTELIYDLLNISKLRAGRMEFNERVFDFGQVVKEVVDVMQQSNPKHKLILKGRTQKQVYGDDDRIGQVISNLVSNATKYSPHSDRVIIHLRENNKKVQFGVEDFGIGISEKHLHKIFERFYRVYDATDKTFPGLGIGLYICSEIVKRHKGKLWVESNEGKGSTFYFTLPIYNPKKNRSA